MGKLCLLVCAVSLLLAVVSSPESVLAASSPPPARRRYGSIFSLGDSYADTGNGPVVFGWHSIANPVMRPPYGSTFFGRPTGRNCDGRLPIDFLAESLGLPLVPPFLARSGTATFRRGANFAVGGATALDASFFHRWDPPGGSVFPLNTSLGVQMQWFESLKPSLCATTKQCKELFGTSLFFVGAFGANDYLLSLAAKSIDEVRSFVPDVVRTISMAVERLIRHGATTLVVPGVIPVGCAPPVLVTFADPDPAGYDPRTGCLKAINDLAAHHNALLQDALRELQAKQRPAGAVTVVYADFFRPVIEMVTSPAKFGFEDVLTLCCGGPGRFNYNKQVFCGDPGAIRCRDPSARLFWDGVHLTEAAYRHVAAGWLSSIESPRSAGAGTNRTAPTATVEFPC
ncbi:hypothetical protein GQ55_5G532100 [Panicum hallii var. hallii]|uniref:GDSL esterase/lipase n=1 Tax=Panicum hallii var. hallii TaxID=1504633 RepID=A0A2T7DT42_9POAL|nr:hypothetical protein GQ55_5G532100 [Panicum hallii var. hallii]